ncbi:MAG: hypothetical protein IKC32_05535 [Clostridia bacterium]|nr:hypothetical protein [Clostridia bacterium]
MQFSDLVFGRLDLALIIGEAEAVLNGAIAHPAVSPVVDAVGGYLEDAPPVLLIILLVSSFLLCLFGSRLIKLLIRLVFFILGYVIGASLVAGLLLPSAPIPFCILIGVILALLLSVASGLLFPLALTLSGGGGMYIMVIYGVLFPQLRCMVPVAIVGFGLGVLLSIIFYDYIIALLTAVAGAYSSAVILSAFLDYASYGISETALALILSLAAFVIQIAFYQRKKKSKQQSHQL